MLKMGKICINGAYRLISALVLFINSLVTFFHAFPEEQNKVPILQVVYYRHFTQCSHLNKGKQD